MKASKEEKRMMRKTNMWIFPIYKQLGWDFLFFYTIDFLFLTQVKGISASDVVLKSTFYAFFSIIVQIPANIIVEFLGRKNSIILANVLNCVYMVIIMLSRNLFDLIVAEFFDAIAFSIKNVAEPSLLNESIPPSRYKSQIYSKINAKGTSGYYFINSISKILAGFLFAINGYLPMICSLIVLIFVTILSIAFIEPVRKKKKSSSKLMYIEQIKDVRDGFAFILKSERLKALILCASLVDALIWLLMTYHVSLQEELRLSSIVIGIVAAIGAFISAYASKKQNQFHNKYRNKSLYIISILVSVSTIFAGIFGIKAEGNMVLLLMVILAFLLYSFCVGVFNTIIDRYLRNFANQSIDTKIFAAKNLFKSIFRMITSLFAAFLLTKTTTAYCMIILGVIFTIIYVLVGKYMESRVGLKPEEYSSIEKKYDELSGNS